MAGARKLDPAGWLTLLQERAPLLRAAGVRSLSIDGVSVELTPHEPPPPERTAREMAEQEDPTDLLDDPASFGLRPGDPLPGFTRPKKE